MLYRFGPSDYGRVVQSIGSTQGHGSSFVADYMAKVYRRAVHSIVSQLGKELSTSEMSVLLFVADRTLFYSNLSATITKDQFSKGMHRTDTGEMIFSGINISEMTLAKCINSLVARGLLHVGVCTNADEKSETRVRIYAINCKSLINIDIMDEEKPMVLRIPREKKVGATPPLKLGDIYTHSSDTKVSHIGGSATDSGIRIPRMQTTTKPRATATPIQANIRDRVAALQQQGTARKAEFIATAKATPGSQLTKASMQAIINPLMADFFPALPTMRVTDKPFGKLRKDLKIQPLPDFAGFLHYVISSWEQIASDHARAGKRQAAQGLRQTYSPMPNSPDFTTLAYRFTYFLKCYNSHVTQNTQLGTVDQRKDEEAERLRRQIAQLREENASHVQVARKARMAQQRAPRPVPIREVPPPTIRSLRTPPARPAVDIMDDLEIPTWDQHTRSTRRA